MRLPLPFRSNSSTQQKPLLMQHISSSAERIILFATSLHSAGGVDSWHALKDIPSSAQVWLPQNVQNEVMQVRLLLGTQTWQRFGQSE